MLVALLAFMPVATAQVMKSSRTISARPVVSGGGGSWLPTDEASLVAWYKADVGVTNTSDVTPPSDGDSIKGWKDNSAHGIAATNFLGGGAEPIFKTALQNGLPGVRFNGTTQEFRANAMPPYLVGDDIPMIWAMAFRNNKTLQAGIWFQEYKGDGGAEWSLRGEIDGSDRYYVSRHDASIEKDAFVNYTGGVVNWHVVVLLFTGTTVSWYHDGTLQTPSAQDLDTATIDSSSDRFYIGRDAGGVYFGGDMGEILIFNSASVSPATIYTYLKGRWNTP